MVTFIDIGPVERYAPQGTQGDINALLKNLLTQGVVRASVNGGRVFVHVGESVPVTVATNAPHQGYSSSEHSEHKTAASQNTTTSSPDVTDVSTQASELATLMFKRAGITPNPTSLQRQIDIASKLLYEHPYSVIKYGIEHSENYVRSNKPAYSLAIIPNIIDAVSSDYHQSQEEKAKIEAARTRATEPEEPAIPVNLKLSNATPQLEEVTTSEADALADKLLSRIN